MKGVTTSFNEKSNARENRPVWLFTLFDYDGAGTNLNYAKWHEDVTFDSVIYSAAAVTVDTIRENSQGSVDTVRLTIGNINRVMSAILEANDIQEKKVRARLVWSDDLSDTSNKLDLEFYVDSVSYNQEACVIVLSTKTDVMRKMLPGGMYLRNHCRWRKFKDPDTCGYAGAETECNRTVQRCKELNNFERFGGFPSLPQKRIYVS